MSGINTFYDIEESKTPSDWIVAKAQPLSKEIAGSMSYCPDPLNCDHEWYDARYEKGETVTVWAIIPYPVDGGASPIVSYDNQRVELINSAVDIFSQASAAIALCILSLNLF